MSMLNEPTVDFHLKLNEQTFHIPNELLKNNVKKVHKLVEHESRRLNQLFDDVNIFMGAQESQNIINKLNEIIKVVELLERKLEKRVNVECELLKRIEYRINYYKELESLKSTRNRDGLINWYQRYTNILIGEYLTRNNNLYDQELGVDSKTGANIGTDLNAGIRQKRKMSSPTVPNLPMNAGFQFLKSQNLENYLDYDILITANQIANSLETHHDLSLLISWIRENQAFLESKSSVLEFETRFQEYIELVKVQNYPGAINCFQTHLINFIHTNFEELKLASGLLVFIKSCKGSMLKQHSAENDLTSRRGFFQFFFRKPLPKTFSPETSGLGSDSAIVGSSNGDFERYTRVLDDERWDTLKGLFLQEYYSMYGISQHDPLLIYLSLGISTLKTKACLQGLPNPDAEDSPMDNFLHNELNHSKCPVCSAEFAPLASDLPYAHHIQSNLFDNPVMLPNGNVYDGKKLKALANKLVSKNLCSLDTDQIMDPVDRSVYNEKEFITMYPT
ncbi:LADA_0E10836g1_1 [Lachancea dasiensis]|uniref:LADA_0E10836g1_1 n=1 Tax=Lachancea dasiensis TaxID=1072105 RepID=A0A1G4JEK9_9SACH|nr:LADA_0E10836g1_1 [Lachancea dasiensis]